ncbi:DUF5955 family protein [Streptomyces sp. SPB074]|uniref:DUF5955 family protein n=1 Tax=Streptomyces sp. (strain SPB074) TaxID=465543 RepID=UPI0001D1E072|nr:DUF5955 family protein [Streptomyces sp. SPB074]EFG64398.1 conserved hypothetical protein [Streptomyces sp. SPB074]
MPLATGTDRTGVPVVITGEPVDDRRPGEDQEDPRIAELREAAAELRLALAVLPADLTDRDLAEAELAAFTGLLSGPAPSPAALSGPLLRLAATTGSVSALAPALARLRAAVELFGGPGGR